MPAGDHLHPSVLPLLKLSDKERIWHILSGCWIGYTRATSILAEMQALLDHPPAVRMPGMLIVGVSNQGKSTLLRKFLSAHPPQEEAEITRTPVVLVECPVGPDENELYRTILDSLSVPYRFSEGPAVNGRRVADMFAQVGTRVLILDELHNVLTGPVNRQKRFMNVLKTITNKTGVCLVAAGTPAAQNAVNTEPQIENRLRPMYLPRWQEGEDFWTLLASFETMLPLAKPSGLSQDPLASEIITLSEGTLGEVVTILSKSAAIAIRDGKEAISLKIVRSLNFVPPSKRPDPRAPGN